MLFRHLYSGETLSSTKRGSLVRHLFQGCPAAPPLVQKVIPWYLASEFDSVTVFTKEPTKTLYKEGTRESKSSEIDPNKPAILDFLELKVCHDNLGKIALLSSSSTPFARFNARDPVPLLRKRDSLRRHIKQGLDPHGDNDDWTMANTCLSSAILYNEVLLRSRHTCFRNRLVFHARRGSVKSTTTPVAVLFIPGVYTQNDMIALCAEFPCICHITRYCIGFEMAYASIFNWCPFVVNVPVKAYLPRRVRSRTLALKEDLAAIFVLLYSSEDGSSVDSSSS
ncbi:MAG: hypothetical protein J3Q66DRAFT_413882 [Benniella sp.]|nr:MAG: hypothetical protein J3Q66DRAFT_413882 [Benniella sp.]